MSIPPATVSSCGKPMATIYGNDTVVFREKSRGTFMRNAKKKPNFTWPRRSSWYRYDIVHLKSGGT